MFPRFLLQVPPSVGLNCLTHGILCILKGADVKAKLFKKADEKECIFRFAFNEFGKLGLLILHQKYL